MIHCALTGTEVAHGHACKSCITNGGSCYDKMLPLQSAPPDLFLHQLSP
jgi:hypothetical protein